MAIPARTREKILEAIEDFHLNRRHTEAGWNSNRSQKYALVHNNTWYPPKQIISIATGMDVQNFNGGESPGSANPYLRKLGFEIINISETIQWTNAVQIIEGIINDTKVSQDCTKQTINQARKSVIKTVAQRMSNTDPSMNDDQVSTVNSQLRRNVFGTHEEATGLSEFDKGLFRYFTQNDDGMLNLISETQRTANPQSYERLVAVLNLGREQYASGTQGSMNGDNAETAREEEEMSEKLGQFLELNPQVILAGPPGTSKTHCASQFLEGADRFREGEKNGFESKKKYWDIVQFHPSYGYEDFVMGIEAKTNDSGQLGFEPRKGIFLKMAEQAVETPQSDFYLVIDEINRGVMGRIFGELILTLEYRDFDVHIPGLDAALRVPKNLFLIGTMNTADRNIALIDHALRRRFMVLKMLPEMRQLESYHSNEIPDKEALQNLSKEAFNIVQTAFKKGDEYDEDKNGYNMEDYAVGHTYFMAKSQAKLKANVEHQVIPLLGEYMREGIIDKSMYASVKSQLEQLLGL